MDRSVVRPPSSLEPPLVIGRALPPLDSIPFSRSARGRRHAAAILLVAVLAVLAFKAFPLQSITLISGDTTLQVRSTFGEEGALAAASVDLAPGDRVLVGREGEARAVSVERATPVVVSVDGALVEVRSRARTVAGALALAHVEVGEGDRIYVDGFRAALDERLGDIAAEGSVAAASEGQPVQIEVVRALPAAPAADGGAAGSAAGVTPLEAVSAGPTLGVLVHSDAWRPVVSGLPPDEHALSLLVMALPPKHAMTFRIGGELEALRTEAETVADVLALYEVELGEHDRLSHGLEEPITEGMALVLTFVEKVVEEHTQYLSFRMYYRDDHTLAPGETRTVAGEPGEVRVWEEVTYENGAAVSREPHSAVRVKDPVAGEYLRGPVADDGVSPLVVDDYTGPYVSRLRVWATWYDASHGWWAPDDPSYGTTYTGVRVDHGICAVDPDYIPLGTRFYVPGYGECLAADIGGLINGYDVDLGFPDDHAPRPWHTGYVHIYILD